MLNTKNQLMAQALLNNLSGNTKSLFGPQKQDLISAPEPRDVTPRHHDDFEPEPSPDPEPTIEALRMAALSDLLDKYESMMSAPAVQRSRDAISRRDHEDIKTRLDAVKVFLATKGINLGGGE
jgi:hypothetical protein